MTRSIKTLIVSLGAGLLGVVLSMPSVSLDLQEHFGLKLLFTLRGKRRPPSEVIIITMDQASIERLNLPKRVQNWPRALHAQLVQTLTHQGARLIVFDLLFDEPTDVINDNRFAGSLAESKRVVLCASIRQERHPITDADGKYLADLTIETVVPPIPVLAQNALAAAPFPLPKVPVQLSQFWMFKAGAGNSPTLPVVAFFVYASSYYSRFYQIYSHAHAYREPAILPSWNEIVARKGIEEVLTGFREAFVHDPSIINKMVNILGAYGGSHDNVSDPRMLRRLINMFGSENSRHLNFYGPAGTIQTQSYYKVLADRTVSAMTATDTPDGNGFEGKVVFVGLSENLRPQRQDGYHTVFSQKNGIDISGVEIAATAFANLLEDRLLRPLTWPLHRLVVFVFGSLLGVVCFSSSMRTATISVLVVSGMYMAAAVICFNTRAVWIPVVIPVFILTPLAMVGTVVCRYCSAQKERESIRKAFGYYLPDPVIDQLAKNLGNIDATSQVVYGICLYTDAQQYSALSESLDPKALRHFMNRYYEHLFVPVKKHGGIVSDVVGDSMMAIWAKSKPDVSLRAAACKAAIGIQEAIRAFNRENPNTCLHTRIGMHAGHILVGNIGAVDHYEYRPVGDIVNTASRIEGLNQQLGTQTMVSEQVLVRLDGFATRKLGQFLPYGKSNSVTLYELLGESHLINDTQVELCSRFEMGLCAYEKRRWDDAIEAFSQTLSIYRADGPAIFYKRICERLKMNPPDESWDGTVVMQKK